MSNDRNKIVDRTPLREISSLRVAVIEVSFMLDLTFTKDFLPILMGKADKYTDIEMTCQQ